MNSIIDEVLTKDSKDGNELPDLDRSTDKSNITGDICESIKSRESIFAIATEESKNVCPQEEEEKNINTSTTKVDETIVKTEEYEETAAKKSKTVINNDKNINPTINKECSESKYNKRDGDIVKKEPEEQTKISNIKLDRDQEICEIRVRNANDSKAKDLTDDENKELFISEKPLFEKEYETEFITLEEDELNKIRDLYKSTSINSNVFESLKSTERIVAVATKELKGVVCPQVEEQTIAYIQENKEKAENNSKPILDNDKNIKVEDIEIPGDEELDEIILPDKNDDGEDSVYNYQTQQSNYLSTALLQPETKNTTVYSTSSSSPYSNSNSITSSALIRKRKHEKDENECIPDISKAQEQQVKSNESSFIQSKATRSQRLTTSVKRFKRSTKAGINAPTQRIRLNDITAGTVTSIEEYTENNDAEDLLQATWIENDEQQQQPQQQAICQLSPSTVPTSRFSKRRYGRKKERISIGNDDDNENNGNLSLVSAVGFPKNVDPQMFINDENEGICVICNKDFIGRLVYHYVNAHRGCEIYNSRLSRTQIELVKQGRCEIFNVSRCNRHTYYEAFCIFCQKNLRLVASCWYEHFTRHTGEFAYRCTGCGLRNIRQPTVKRHQARKCPKARVAQDYFRSSASFFPMAANVCYLCNYVQLYRSNIEKHLHIQHNIKQIFLEHIQTIVLLPKPKSMTAKSTDSRIDSSTGDEERDENIVPDSAEAEDLTDDKYKMQLIDEKSLLEIVEDEKNSEIKAALFKKETSNKSIFNNDVQDIDDSSSNSYSEEDETEFVTLKEDELNKIRDLYKSTDKSTIITSNVFKSLKSTERIVTAATEELKGVSPQQDIQINTTTTKIDETIENIQEIVDNYKNIKVEDIETSGHRDVDEIIVPNDAEDEDLTADKNKIQLIAKEILLEGVEDEYTPHKSKPKTKNENESSSENDDSYRTPQPNYLNAVKLQPETTNTTVSSTSSSSSYPNINSLTSSALKRERQYEEDEDKYTTDKSKAQKQQGISDESAFTQPLATRSQRLATSVKRLKRSPEAGINAPTKRIRLNDTTAATVTSIEQYTENNDAEDLLQATWIDNFEIDETQISNDNPAKKQQQEPQQQDYYSSTSELPTICQPSPSLISNSELNEKLYERNQEEIIIGDDDDNSDSFSSLLLPSHAEKNQQEIIIGGEADNENNDNPPLVSSLCFPKNVDPQMFINEKNKYRCVICNGDFNNLVHHYVNEHRGCEIYNSRLSPSQIKLVKQGRCDITNGSLYKSTKYFEAFCIFCQENQCLRPLNWHQHFTRHTGEFVYRCTGCGLRKPIRDFREHRAQGCPKAGVAVDYFRQSKGRLSIEANVCNLCNYLQLHRSNIEKHLHTQHNIKEILPEHIQTILILSTGSGNKIYSKRNKSDAAPSLPSSSHDSNTYANDDNGDDNNATFDKMLPEEPPPATDHPTIKDRFDEFTKCHKATGDFTNIDGSPSLLLPSHAEKNPEEIIIGDDDENNDNSALVPALGFPKNVDPQMVANDENKGRCVICNEDLNNLVHHYVNEHRGCEIYNSRLSLSQIKLVKQGRCEVSKVSVFKRKKYYEAFCIFCQKSLRLTSYSWYQHFPRHTGEFAYSCTGCGLRKPMRDDVRRHLAQGCLEARVAQDYFRGSKGRLPIEANVCNLCNYMQLQRSNIVRHLHVQHNIKQILPEHIQTIALLSIPTSMTATSKLSLPSSSHDSNTYVSDDNDDDSDIPFDKILPEETPPETDPPTIKNRFEEFTNCHKATGDFNNIDSSPSLLLPSHAEKNQEGIIIGVDDENNDNTSLVSAVGCPKNVDPQMFINNKNKERCVICNDDFKNSLVDHYVNEHRGCEVYNSRLSPSQIKLVKEGGFYNVSLYKNGQFQYEAFCIFCLKFLRFMLPYWYQHLTLHTGEYAYRCIDCGLRKPMRALIKKHQDQGWCKAIAQDYFHDSGLTQIEVEVCNLCNYVQLHRSNITKHLHVQHNIEQVLPEHIQTIVLLSSTGSGIATRVSSNSGGVVSPSLLSSETSNPCVIDNVDNAVTSFGKILPEETPPQTNPPTINNNTFEEFISCKKATGDLNNSDGLSSVLLSSNAENNQEGIMIDDYDENNDNSSLVTALAWPKNDDPQMFMNNENKDRCVICNKVLFGRLVHHYVNEHRGCEIYNSRLSPSQIKLVKQGRCEVDNVSLYNRCKHYEAFCIFCQKNLRFPLPFWYDHFIRHTGEFPYRCTGCGLRKAIPKFKKHHAQGCLGAKVAQDYLFSLKSFRIEVNVCNFCNYVQLHRNNIERHLHMQHNIEQISNEHTQTIALLSIPTSMTATSTENKIISRRLYAPNTYVNEHYDDYNDATFDKVLPKESPAQGNPPTFNNTFEEFASKACGNSLDWPKNVDPQMFISDENKNRCIICNLDFTWLVPHYVNEHPGCEIYNSRLSPSQIKIVKLGHCEVSNVTLHKNYKHYDAFCIFCQKNLSFSSSDWYDHFTRHTGEFSYRCTGCGMRKPRRPEFRKHQAQVCPKAKVVQDYFRSSKSCFPMEANVCTLCNYVQLYRCNIAKHLHTQHNIKNILPEQIQTIVLLSIPTIMTATSTPSLPSSSHTSNTYVIDNDDKYVDVTFDKILPEESSLQTNLPTINNNKQFEKFPNCYRETTHLNNVDTSASLSLLSEDGCNTYVIDNDDKDSDNNVTFEKMVKQETSLQANLPTINQTFDESTDCHTVICSKVITLADVSAADA